MSTVQDEIAELATFIAREVRKEDIAFDLRLSAFKELVAYAGVLAKGKTPGEPPAPSNTFGALRDRVRLVDEDRDDEHTEQQGVHTRRRR